MAKVTAGRPDQNRKPGKEGLKYTPVDQALGGPTDNNPKPGLGADKGVIGSSKLPPVKKG